MYANRGLGEAGALQREVNRLFRTTEEYERPSPHVIHAEDITRGLGLDSITESKILQVIRETRFDFGFHPKLRVPRVVHARLQLSTVMRAANQIDSSTRMEIMRRAMAYWKRNGSDYQQDPNIRYVFKKGMDDMPSDISRRYEDDEEGKPAGDRDGDGIPNAVDKRPGKKGKGASEMKGSQKKNGKGKPPQEQEQTQPEDGAGFDEIPTDDEVEDAIIAAVKNGQITPEEAQDIRDEWEMAKQGDQQAQSEVVSALHAMEETEIDGGRTLDFGHGVSAHLPDDADFHHHATEYAKHRAAHQIHKGKDSGKAEAHKHAANIHASVGNALHSAGDTERRRGLDAGGELMPNGQPAPMAPGEVEELPAPPGPLGQQSPGANIAGGPQPAMPDGQRNPPGRDSEHEAMKGKLSALVGKMSGKGLPTMVRKPPRVEMGRATIRPPVQVEVGQATNIRRRPPVQVEVGQATNIRRGAKMVGKQGERETAGSWLRRNVYPGAPQPRQTASGDPVQTTRGLNPGKTPSPKKAETRPMIGAMVGKQERRSLGSGFTENFMPPQSRTASGDPIQTTRGLNPPPRPRGAAESQEHYNRRTTTKTPKPPVVRLPEMRVSPRSAQEQASEQNLGTTASVPRIPRGPAPSPRAQALLQQYRADASAGKYGDRAQSQVAGSRQGAPRTPRPATPATQAPAPPRVARAPERVLGPQNRPQAAAQPAQPQGSGSSRFQSMLSGITAQGRSAQGSASPAAATRGTAPPMPGSAGAPRQATRGLMLRSEGVPEDRLVKHSLKLTTGEIPRGWF